MLLKVAKNQILQTKNREIFTNKSMQKAIMVEINGHYSLII